MCLRNVMVLIVHKKFMQQKVAKYKATVNQCLEASKVSFFVTWQPNAKSVDACAKRKTTQELHHSAKIIGFQTKLFTASSVCS